MPDDTLEKHQQSRFRYYQTALDLVEAEVYEIEVRARMLQYIWSDDGALQTALTD